MRLGLILGEVGQGLRRNLSMVVSVVLVTFISLTFVGTAILLQFQIAQMKGYWYDRSQVAVYLCTDFDGGECANQAATQSQTDAVEAELNGDTLAPYIERVEFETREQAYQNVLDQYEGTAIADLASPEILPEAFRIKLVNPDQAEIIIDQISGMPGVDEVSDDRAFLEPIFTMINTLSLSAVGIAALMLIAAALLVATTIRLSAFSRRREISIMRLVGASNRFIETPFILEGVVAALIGSALAGVGLVVLTQFFVGGYLADALPTVNFVGTTDALLVAPMLLGVGAVLAALSASVAIRRYLKA
ncbi:permease-like cell division protein FtsX [Pseudolysinimonas sp.]|uniref:permease-like cell division protein FtsX n=1 Tax=Pseudolysinimonas sp. TaxID=2680009 RepID=UPI00286C6331|nr:permease-like cell division protein FtsX [Pseudolysinimonas sp.]